MQQKIEYRKPTLSFSILLLLTISSYTMTEAFSTLDRGINWADMCRLADVLISEPCYDLVNPNNPYKLTSEGERVLKCIGGGALALATGHPELLALGPSVGCGGGSSYDYEPRGRSGPSDNPIGDLISKFLHN